MLLLLASVLAGCAADGSNRTAPPAPARDWLAQIRAEAAKVPSAVDVVPLADPAVDDLRRRAAKAEAEQRYEDAETDLRAALVVREGDPALWQSLAEIAVVRRQWPQAEAAAQKSWELGPRVGALCVRNWFTVFATRIERGDATGAATARAKVQTCVVAEPTRF
jgi:hypothetical protein